jgi:hypothetical protein
MEHLDVLSNPPEPSCTEEQLVAHALHLTPQHLQLWWKLVLCLKSNDTTERINGLV